MQIGVPAGTKVGETRIAVITQATRVTALRPTPSARPAATRAWGPCAS